MFKLTRHPLFAFCQVNRTVIDHKIYTWIGEWDDVEFEKKSLCVRLPCLFAERLRL